MPGEMGFRNLSIIFLVLFLLVSGFFPVSADEPEEPQILLLINSYHPSLTWTRNITEGVLSGLGDNQQKYSVAIEYLDWKNYPSQDVLATMEQLYRFKYANRPIRLVITSDDAALQFALSHRDIFSNASIVFTGLNGYESLHPYTYPNVTGVVEAINPYATLQTAFAMFPDTKQVLIICENTESGREICGLILNATEKIPHKAEYITVGNVTTAEVYNQVERMLPGSIILIGSWSVDSTGKVIDIGQFAEEVVSKSRVPVFNLYDFNFGKGTAGGSILSGWYQGYHAGIIASDILSGTDISTIPVIKENATQYSFDFAALERFGVRPEQIPPGSVLINQPFDIISAYLWLIIAGILIIIILTIGLIALIYIIIQRKKVELLIYLFIDALPGFAFYKDGECRYQMANLKFLETIGLNRDELKGKTDMEIYPADLAEGYHRDDLKVFETGMPLYIPEEEIPIRPGRRIPVSTRKVPVKNRSDEVIGVIGLAFDISEQKQVEKALRESNEKYYNLFELGWEAIFLFDAETGKILEANSAAVNMYGYSRDELLTMTNLDISAEPDKTIEILKDSSKEFFSVPMRYHRKKNKTRFRVEIMGRYFDWKGKRVLVAAMRDVTDRILVEETLRKANEKVSLFNYLTRTTMNNQLFILRGYMDLAAEAVTEKESGIFIKKSVSALEGLERLVLFMKNYQDLGLKPAVWSNVEEVFLYALSHEDMSQITHKLSVSGLYIFADPFLEKVFHHLVENSIIHGEGITEITLRYEMDHDDLLLIYTDDGVGIPDEFKKKMFDLRFEGKAGIGLILVKEILAITGITIEEQGIFGKGTIFVMRVPEGGFKISPSESLPGTS